MMTDEIKSFEQLWNEVEKRSLQVNKNDDSIHLLDDIGVILGEIQRNIHEDNELPEDIKSSITSDLIGELLYNISTITARENVNIWLALKKHMDNT